MTFCPTSCPNPYGGECIDAFPGINPNLSAGGDDKWSSRQEECRFFQSCKFARLNHRLSGPL
jgi:hypothetical protein